MLCRCPSVSLIAENVHLGNKYFLTISTRTSTSGPSTSTSTTRLDQTACHSTPCSIVNSHCATARVRGLSMVYSQHFGVSECGANWLAGGLVGRSYYEDTHLALLDTMARWSYCQWRPMSSSPYPPSPICLLYVETPPFKRLNVTNKSN